MACQINKMKKNIQQKSAKISNKNNNLICLKCNGKGWYFVNEWIGDLQGRKDCNCKKNK